MNIDPYGLGGIGGIAGMSNTITYTNKIKTADDYLTEAYDALKLAAGLLTTDGQITRARWALKAMQKVLDARG